MKKLKFVLFIFISFATLVAYAQNAEKPLIIKGTKSIDLVINIQKNKPLLEIKLPANPTTGYIWFIKNYDKDLLTLSSHDYLPPNSKLIGAPGMEKWVFTVSRTGFVAPQITKVSMEYLRPWNVKEKAKQANIKVLLQ